jgi:N-ethylmaleimide reductase
MSTLFTPAQIGAFNTAHRIVMAPLTRMRAGAGDVPNDLMVKYYAQRASEGGLIISEATVVSPNGRGYLGAPGIFTDEQVAGWKTVVEAVHAKGGKMFLQLWHVGRQSHSDLQPGNASPVAPSAVEYDGVAYTSNGWVPVTPARALEVDEIAAIIEDYREAAIRAKGAGFDGVEIHSANGYLVDQFLQDGSNKRTDHYGGSLENRVRFLLEVADAVVSVWGADRVGVRLTPSGTFGGMSDSNPEATFRYVAQQLDGLGLAYLHVVEPRVMGSEADQSKDQNVVAVKQLREVFKGTIIAAGGFEPYSAETIVTAGEADLVAFGRHFIANPDLVFRIKSKAELNAYDRDTFYGGDEKGYIDYPSLS